MMASRTAKLLLVTSMIMLVLLPMGAVWAVPPVKTVTEFVFPDEPIWDCGDFWIRAHSDWKITRTEYYDKDGNLKVVREHWAVSNGQLYNEWHPEISLPEGPDHILWTIDPETGIQALSGLALHLNIPGQGIVAIDAGRAILDENWNVLWERGPHMYFEGGLDFLCPYFAFE